jgi:hypothetical protein
MATGLPVVEYSMVMPIGKLLRAYSQYAVIIQGSAMVAAGFPEHRHGHAVLQVNLRFEIW